MDYENNIYNRQNITSQNINYINNIQEKSTLFHKDNFLSNNNHYSNSMIDPKVTQNIFSAQNYQLQSSYPNNLNYKYKNNTPFNTNSNLDEYKYISNNNEKNISLTSQISQEIDRQKTKFDEMVEKAKNINNSEIYEFDLRKYLPKDNFENSKTFRKYKDLIKPNVYSNRNNYFNKKNNEFKYNEIKDNSLSEIPIRNDNLFEDELSNFNLDNKEIINENIDENKKEINEQESLKQNLMSNDNNNNDINNNNNNSNNKNLKENSNVNNNNYNEQETKKDKENIKPYYYVFYEKVNINNNNNIKNEESEDEEELNDIEKLNKELNDKNNNKINDINDFVWHCLDFSEEKPEYIFNDFFNNKEI